MRAGEGVKDALFFYGGLALGAALLSGIATAVLAGVFACIAHFYKSNLWEFLSALPVIFIIGLILCWGALSIGFYVDERKAHRKASAKEKNLRRLAKMFPDDDEIFQSEQRLEKEKQFFNRYSTALCKYPGRCAYLNQALGFIFDMNLCDEYIHL